MRSKILSTLLVSLSCFGVTHALLINEVMSNPTGDDGGREWIELYNDATETVDVSSLTISVKGGIPLITTPVSGGVSIPAHGYAVIGSTVSGATRFLQDYGSYDGVLLKSAISLVNTGVTSLDIRLGGAVVDSIVSYTAAKEGYTYSLLHGAFALGTPTPGKENQSGVASSDTTTSTSTTISNQVTIPQMSPPSADIILYLPSEKMVVAGAPSTFSVSALTMSGKSIDAMRYLWAFGDGGQGTGSSTEYRYLYPGRYITQVEGTNGLVAGVGRMMVRVLVPDLSMSKIEVGKYGPYITITNPNTYDLDVSLWKLSIDGALFSFPKNTLLGVGSTRISGLSMGFGSTTVSSTTLIKILFPNLDELLRVHQEENLTNSGKIDTLPTSTLQQVVQDTKSIGVSRGATYKKPAQVWVTSTTTLSLPNKGSSTSIFQRKAGRDTRLVAFIKSIFSK